MVPSRHLYGRLKLRYNAHVSIKPPRRRSYRPSFLYNIQFAMQFKERPRIGVSCTILGTMNEERRGCNAEVRGNWMLYHRLGDVSGAKLRGQKTVRRQSALHYYQ